MDRLSKEHRSWNMSRIRGRDTNPEMTVRSMLHRMGFRFRVHCSKLPGKPDIVLKRYKTVIFVHGCFWHHHPGCMYATNPGTRIEFWQKKFAANVSRDIKVANALTEMGWKVAVVWECELSNLQSLADRLELLLKEPSCPHIEQRGADVSFELARRNNTGE